MNESTIDQQFIEYVVKSLVGKPDAVIVERIIDEKGVLLTLTVDPEDLGRVIGKKGATAQSLRTLLRALGTKNEARYNLKIVDNGIPREEREAAKNAENPSRKESSAPVSNDGWGSSDDDSSSNDDAMSTSDDSSSAAQDAANDSGEEESAIERTRRELEDLDDLDV
jgi:predicted RNA-binding protein YlqC (UPF0109 family)